MIEGEQLIGFKETVIDITDLVEQEKKMNTKKFIIITAVFALAALGILTLSFLTKILQLEYTLMIGLAAIALFIIILNLPNRKRQKQVEPFVLKIKQDLLEKGYKFADVRSKKGLAPWLSSRSTYLYGEGLTLSKSLEKGLRARRIKFKSGPEKPIYLTAERLISPKSDGVSTMIKIVQYDKGETKPLTPAINITSHPPRMKTRKPQRKEESVEAIVVSEHGWSSTTLT